MCYSGAKGWNITKLLDLIINNIPAQLRLPRTRSIGAKAAAQSVDDAMDKMHDGISAIMSRSLNDLMRTGIFWLDESFHDKMTDVMGKMGGASGTLEFALGELDDDDFAEDICEAVDDFNSAIQDMYNAINGANSDVWRHVGNAPLKDIYYGLQDLGNALINIANSLGYVDEQFSSLMEDLQQNIHKVLARINTLGK